MIGASATRSIWLAAFLLASELRFHRAVGRHDPRGLFRGEFVFEDPDGLAPALTRKFLDDVTLQRTITARRILAAVLDVARRSGICEPADVADELARIER